jgi:hypothetical protein
MPLLVLPDQLPLLPLLNRRVDPGRKAVAVTLPLVVFLAQEEDRGIVRAVAADGALAAGFLINPDGDDLLQIEFSDRVVGSHRSPKRIHEWVLEMIHTQAIPIVLAENLDGILLAVPLSDGCREFHPYLAFRRFYVCRNRL